MDSLYLTAMRGVMLGTSSGGGSGSDGSITKFITALGDQLAIWGRLIVFAIGAVMIIVGIYQVAKNLMSAGRGQANWAVTLLLIVIGGTLMAAGGGGWSTLLTFGDDGANTLEGLAAGSTETNSNNENRGKQVILPGVVTTYIAE